MGINGGAAKFLLTLATVFDEPWGVAVLEISSSLNTLLTNVPVLLFEAFWNKPVDRVLLGVS